MTKFGYPRVRTMILLLSMWCCAINSKACTIVSAVSKNGQVWTMNNEDGYLGIANFINVFPKEERNKYGYYTLSYFSPEWGTDGRIQGGMNEMGLTFDFNTIDPIVFDFSSRAPFPKGDDEILPHILGNLSNVDEVVTFFETYWFQGGFTAAQMHVADRSGNFAIISASGVYRPKKGSPLVSTNFDICGKQDGSSCWRYPIAEQIINEKNASYATLLEISQKTAQKGGGTLYTNIQNLSTGDIWFMSQHDPGKMVQINIRELLDKGRRSFTFSRMDELLQKNIMSIQRIERQDRAPIDTDIALWTGAYSNKMIGAIEVKQVDQKLRLQFADNSSALFYPIGEDHFQLDEESDIQIQFENGELRFIENGFWSFSAVKKKVNHEGIRQPIPVLNFGTFHMGYTPDKHKTVYHGTLANLKKEVHDIARLLASFRPTVILVEVPPEFNEELHNEYTSYLSNPKKSFPEPMEIDLLAYELGRLSGTERIYGIDHMMEYDYEIASKIINEIDPEFYNYYDSDGKAHFSSPIKSLDSLDVYHKLHEINTNEYLDYLIYFNADKLTHVGTKNGFEGTDEAAKFYQRNLRMFSNLNRIPLDPNDRVFILMGATHTAYFRDFIRRNPKYKLVNTFDYLKK